MEFYVVNNRGFANSGFAYGERSDDTQFGEAMKCEECGCFLTSLEWLPPLKVDLSKGKLGDVIYGTLNPFIVSENFKEVYESGNASGILEFRPVTIYRKGQQVHEQYYLPKIAFSGVHVDLEKSGVVQEGGTKKCSTCQKADRGLINIEGVYFSDEEVIKEDVFMVKMLPSEVFFSKRFKEAVMELTNLTFIDAKEFVPIFIRGLRPGYTVPDDVDLMDEEE
jgi:hypothetical protein